MESFPSKTFFALRTYLWLGTLAVAEEAQVFRSDTDSGVAFRVGSVGARLDREHSNVLDQTSPSQIHISKLYSHCRQGSVDSKSGRALLNLAERTMDTRSTSAVTFSSLVRRILMTARQLAKY